MTSPEIQHLLHLAEDSHQAAKVLKVLLDKGFVRFSAAQSYYTIFYLAQAMLLTKGLTYSSHSAVVAAFGKEFARTKKLDPKFRRYIMDAQVIREVGHYGEMNEEVAVDQANTSLQWADEFKQAVKEYLGV